LSVDPSRHSVKLTLKKSLVNYDEEIIKSYFEVTPGMKSPGTIVSLKDNGAVLEFFGHVTGYLPVGEISEAFVKSPKDHFRLGQSVAVRVLSVNPEDGKIILSCRVAADNDNALNDLKVCSLVHATVSEKSKDSVIVEIEGGARGVVHCGHLTDGSETKARLKAIKVGDVLDDLVVLDKDMSRRFATLSAKPSLVLACRERKLPSHISDLAVGQKPCGWIKEVTSTGVFIAFANNLTGLASKHDLSLEFIKDPRDKFSKYQSVEAYVTSIDNAKPRFQLSFISKDTGKQTSDLTPGNIVTAKVLAVKETQINVSVGNGVQGRIDASQVFDSYDDIPNKKNTLEAFSKGQEIQARIIGYHDARTHRFLAISHRNASHLVLELSTKPSVVEGSFDADK
jgi:rRNA biogenesis protein RRP5